MPQENKTSIFPLLGIVACTVVMATLLLTTPPRASEPVQLFDDSRVVAMPIGFTGPMSQDWMRMADLCPNEELVRFERPEGLPEYERDMWTCAKYVDAP